MNFRIRCSECNNNEVGICGQRDSICYDCLKSVCYECNVDDLIDGCPACEKVYCAECSNVEECECSPAGVCDGCKKKCDTCNRRVCKCCVHPCAGCNQTRCLECVQFHYCEGLGICNCKRHCVECYDGETYDVTHCGEGVCEVAYCSKCVIDTCKSGENSCNDCLRRAARQL